MFTATHKAAKALLSKKSKSENDDLILPSQSLPERFSHSQLRNELVTQDEPQAKNNDLENLLILSTCLSEPTRLQREDNEQEYITQLSSWISRVILPDSSIVASDETPEDDTKASREAALLRTRQKGSLGLKSLRILQNLSPSSITSSATNNPIFLSLLAFSSSLDPWTTPSALSNSLLLLQTYRTYLHTPEFITTFLLQHTIRPLFSASKPSTITSSSRKAMPSSAPLKPHNLAPSRSLKPWKYASPYSVTLLQWAISTSTSSAISQSWHLITPPILTLLDEMSTPLRLRGIQLLSSFLPKLSSKTLSQTGLGEVFEDAVMPTLLYLPSITPLEESVQLLPAAYAALFVLFDVRFPPISPSPSLSTSPSAFPSKDKPKHLTNLLNHGILPAYTHCSTHPEIMQILLTQLQFIVQKMGIQCVKHLKDIIPILSATLMDPFGTAKPELLLAGLGALREVILNAWPRIQEEGHRREVVRMLVVCWGSVNEEGRGGELEGVRKEMVNVGRVFVKGVEGMVNIRGELRPLIEIDNSLRELFGVDVDG